MEDKEKTRKFLQDRPYSPKFSLMKPNEPIAKNLTFPLIVKSPKSTGSKDVLLATDADDSITTSKHYAVKIPMKPS